jgi:hypothetical protein
MVFVEEENNLCNPDLLPRCFWGPAYVKRLRFYSFVIVALGTLGIIH